MAKTKAVRPEVKTVTLSTGTKVTGAVEVVDKLVKRDEASSRKAPASRAAASK